MSSNSADSPVEETVLNLQWFNIAGVEGNISIAADEKTEYACRREEFAVPMVFPGNIVADQQTAPPSD
jgi:hypothetical protein